MDQATTMSGYFTEERRMIRDTAREFTLAEVLPLANELDPVKGEIPGSLRRIPIKSSSHPCTSS